MKRVTIVLKLEDGKFNEMEEVLLRSGMDKECFETAEQWDVFVIKEYNKTKSYLELYDGNLEESYMDMMFDF